MKRKQKTKINSTVNSEKTNFSVLPFHKTFPITLTYKKDKENKICYFQCEEHMKSYVLRYKLNKNNYVITNTKEKENCNEV